MGNARRHVARQERTRKTWTPELQRRSTQRMGGAGGMADYILRLQRTAGNQAVGRLLQQYAAPRAARPGASATPASRILVQRFTDTPVTDYELQPGEGASPMFTSKDIDPEVTNDNKIRYRYWESKRGDKPELDVADDGTLAIQHTDREPKEFYAAPGRVTAANESLEKVGSWLILNEAGNAIKVGDKTLTMVSPTTNNKDINSKARDFADFVYHRCINLAMKQIGKEYATNYTAEAILQKEGGSETAVTITPGDVDSKEANRLGKMLGESTTTIGAGEARGAMSGKDEPQGVGKDYGTRLGKGEIDESAKELGINQFAKPKVGEAFGTFSMTAEGGDEKRDFSDLTEGGEPTERAFTWGYHYAAVVAASADGKDTITLENYNRADDETAATEELLAKLKVDNPSLSIPGPLTEEETKGKPGGQVRGMKAKRLKDAYILVKEHAGMKREEAEQAHKDAIDAKPGEQWYFRMQGSKKGQSFHEQQAKSGYFTNPLTLRVRRPEVEIAAAKAQRILANVPDPTPLIAKEPYTSAYAGVRVKANNALSNATTKEAVAVELKKTVTALADARIDAYTKEAGSIATANGIKTGAGIADWIEAAKGKITSWEKSSFIFGLWRESTVATLNTAKQNLEEAASEIQKVTLAKGNLIDQAEALAV